MKIFRPIRTASRFGAALFAFALVGTLAGCGGGGNDDGDNARGLTARATLIDTSGRSVGNAFFLQNAPSDPVTIRVQVAGLTPGPHGMHLHEVGRADPNANPPFATAGAHFNPGNKKHGIGKGDGPHAGDLPSLNIGTDPEAVFELTTNRVTLFGGANSLFDSDGSALIIHANSDDQRTDPDGGSGARLICGVVTRD